MWEEPGNEVRRTKRTLRVIRSQGCYKHSHWKLKVVIMWRVVCCVWSCEWQTQTPRLGTSSLSIHVIVVCKLVLDIRKEVQWYSIQDSKWKNSLSSQMAVNWHHTNIAYSLLVLYSLLSFSGSSCWSLGGGNRGSSCHVQWCQVDRHTGDGVEEGGVSTQPP